MNMQDTPQGEALLAELEDSIPQGVPNDTGHRRRAEDVVVDPDFQDLDDLLTQSVTTQQAEAQYKADREAARKNFAGMSKEEVDFCNSRMRAFEMAKVWDAKYAISIWAIYECQNCDRQRMVFSRLMEFHQHKTVATSNRWITVAETKCEDVYPVKEIRPVPTCPRCSEWELDPRQMTDLSEVLG